MRADNSTVLNSSISTTNGVEVVNAPVAIRRSTIVTKGYGLQSGLPQTAITDSQIVLDDPTAVGVEGICDLAIGTITIDAANLTVTGGGSGIAFRSIGSQLCGGHVAVSSSLVQGVGKTVDCAPGIGQRLGGRQLLGRRPRRRRKGDRHLHGRGRRGQQLPRRPQTREPCPRCCRCPASTRRSIDAGDPAAPGAGQPTDFAGLPRAVNGRRDIGAFEYGRQPPPLSVERARRPSPTAEPVTFTATTSDPDLGDLVTVGWSFDDGATASGDQVTHAFATPGVHTATATATDSAGVSTVREKRDGGGDAIRTAKSTRTPRRPITTGLKGPKKVKRGRPAVFSFGSSEGGGTFSCRVDSRPSKPCASPFKVKTRKLAVGRSTRSPSSRSMRRGQRRRDPAETGLPGPALGGAEAERAAQNLTPASVQASRIASGRGPSKPEARWQ